MTSKYWYKGINITLDVYEKLVAVAETLAAQDDVSFDQAFSAFVASRTYDALANPMSLMWSESVPFIVNEYRAEGTLA